MADTVLVTGGAGFIGSHACKALASAGFVPVTFDDFSQGHRSAVQWGPIVEASLLDPEAISAALREYRPLAVLHFAGKISVAESVAEPVLYHLHNVEASENLLNAMAAAGLDKLVYSSTAAVYGEPQQIPIPERHPTAPTNPYGETKLAVERMLSERAESRGLSSVSLRYFNAAGSDPDGEIGEAHDPETHLIPIVLEVAAGKRDAVHVYGDDYDTPDGTCLRDYVHVSDLAEAHVLALRQLLTRKENSSAEAFNLGNGSGYSVLEIVEAARLVTGKDIPVAASSRRDGDPARLVANPAHAKQRLGWAPRYDSLADQIGHAWAWAAKKR